jgi:N-acetylmuramoyl-L-alanine amidase
MNRTSTEAIVIHATATLAHQPFTVASIRAMHRKRGFSDIGYARLIGLKGERWIGRKPVDAVGAHVLGFNHRTLGVAYVGGLDSATAKPRDTRTPAQIDAMIEELKALLKQYPQAVILGHRDLSPDLDHDGIIEPHEWMKQCPCFDAAKWAKSVGLPGGKFDWTGARNIGSIMGGKFVRL